MSRRQTPSQTVGPFFHNGLLRDRWDRLAPDEEAGSPVRIIGHVLDGDGAPVEDALVEIWQADTYGRYRHLADPRSSDMGEAFIGFGRVATADAGRFELLTVRPGKTPAPDGGEQAPHLNVHVLARGLLDQLHTRIYFADEPANDADPLLRSVPDQRRSTLLAYPVDAEPANAVGMLDRVPTSYRFDIILQGEQETVFFAS